MHFHFKAANQREIKGSCSERRRKKGAKWAEAELSYSHTNHSEDEQQNSDPIRNTWTKRFWTEGDYHGKMVLSLTDLNSDVFPELESKSWGKALRGGWTEIPSAQSWSVLWATSHPIPEWFPVTEVADPHECLSYRKWAKRNGLQRVPLFTFLQRITARWSLWAGLCLEFRCFPELHALFRPKKGRILTFVKLSLSQLLLEILHTMGRVT